MAGALVYDICTYVGTKDLTDGCGDVRFRGGIQKIVCTISESSFFFSVCNIQGDDLVGTTGFKN